MCPTDTWVESVNLYTTIALPPGSNKSLVLKRCTAPLVDWEGGERMRLGVVPERVHLFDLRTREAIAR